MIGFAVLAALPVFAGAVRFEADVRPVFEAHCYKCHSAAAKSLKGGLRLDTPDGLRGVAGKPGASPLLQALRHEPDAPEMPPAGKLPRAVVAGVARWVAAGAIDPRTNAASAETSDHWAFQPLRRPAIPTTRSHPIDAFIVAELRKAGLKSSPEASRLALLRRVTYDLTGLPPTRAEIEDFLRDRSADAYEKVVDRLLASPRYGERQARHWLDAIRFAESNGFETNLPRPNAWRFRDWVIRAFNADMPYDQFVRGQLAGDAFAADAATGFLVAGPWDSVKSPDPVLTAQQRADELNGMVSVTASTFLGLTVGCARCHDHKFDPVSHTDYHAFKAVFAGVRHGDRPLTRDPDAKRRRDRAAQLRRQRDELDRWLDTLEPFADPRSTAPRRTPINYTRNVERFAPRLVRFIRFTAMATTEREPCLDELEIFTTGPRPRNAARDEGVTVRSSGDYPESARHKLAHLNDGRYGNGRSWISSQVGKGWVEVELPEAVEVDRVVWGRDREGKLRDRLAVAYRVEVAAERGAWQLVASSDDRAATAVPQPRVARWLRGLRDDVEASLRTTAAPAMAYAGQFTQPEPVYRLNRGDPMQPRERVAPGAIAAIRPRLRLTDATPEQERRLALARWITDPQNPLPARLMANRVWQSHFGTGIVDTPSDFGKNGGTPTHPALLDWLACELMTPTKPMDDRPWAFAPWSLKHLHRLIVTSATYRQSSRATQAGLQRDAADRLLWRYPPRRLEAEAIRDSILAVSGKLDLTMGGPGFDLFKPNGNYVKVYTPKTEFGPETFRRMIYWAKPRMQLDDTFGAFDCPDGGQIAPRRNVSTTPLQALNLLNSPFVLQQAHFFADRLRHEAGDDVKSQVRRAFQLAFGRSPAPDEADAATRLVRQHGLPALCRALFNTNEFLSIE
jgi:hypothetical protein